MHLSTFKGRMSGSCFFLSDAKLSSVVRAHAGVLLLYLIRELQSFLLFPTSEPPIIKSENTKAERRRDEMN